MTSRYAIYFAPAASTELWRFGSAVLGYDAEAGSDAPFPPGPPFDDPDWPGLTAEPRRYGFHATLKAPFGLADGAMEEDLVRAVRAFAGGRRAFRIPDLAVALLGSFVALVPSAASPELDTLAADCVRRFDAFRRPLSAADRARRLAAPLTERQVGHLDEWGYPHVFEDYRFHMTLTGSVPPGAREPVRAALARRYADLPPGALIDGVTLLRQDGPEARFRILERCPFGT